MLELRIVNLLLDLVIVYAEADVNCMAIECSLFNNLMDFFSRYHGKPGSLLSFRYYS